MDPDATHWIGALRNSHEQLRSLAEPLDADGVRRQAYPAEWTIAQVLSHLGSQSQVFELFIDAGLTGSPVPGIDAMQPIWDLWNGKSPEAQVTDSLAVGEEAVKRFESVSPAEAERFHLSLFGMELDLAGLARMRLSEHALHTWDVAAAINPSAPLNDEATGLLVDALDMIAGRGKNPTGDPLQLQVTTTAPARSFVLTANGETVALTSDGTTAATSELTIPAEAFIRLLAGRMDPAHSPEVSTRGVSLDHLRAMFPGF
ncbi:MAG: hypothetical protein JWL70_1948 [Acidimicrobiia bacterium]|nr:hypothetical protein [Acidimicrobiia bacterium]